MEVHRGEVFYADLSPVVGSEQGGIRPVQMCIRDRCNRPRFGVPVLFPSCGNPDNGVHLFDGKAYPMAVSYTHLDVYKRQAMYSAKPGFWMLTALSGRKDGATVNLMVGSSLIFLCHSRLSMGLSLIHI